MPSDSGDSKTKSVRINDEDLLSLLEEEGEYTDGGSSEVIRKALRIYLRDFERFGLEEEDYDQLIASTEDYFTELLLGYEGAAMEIGEEIYSIDPRVGDYLAEVTVSLEENEIV